MTKEINFRNIVVRSDRYPAVPTEADMDRMFDNGDNFDFQQELYEHAEFLEGTLIGRRIFRQESNKLLVLTYTPFSRDVDDFQADEYLSEAHYLQVQQQKHELSLLQRKFDNELELNECNNRFIETLLMR